MNITTTETERRELLQQFYRRTHPDELDKVAAPLQLTRENYVTAKGVARDRDHFADEVFRFLMHHDKKAYGTTGEPNYKEKYLDPERGRKEFRNSIVYNCSLFQHYPGGVYQAEQDSMEGPGLIPIIDRLAEALAFQAVEGRLFTIYWELFRPYSIPTREWLITNIIKDNLAVFADLRLPVDITAKTWAHNFDGAIEKLINRFAQQRYAMHRAMRR